MHDVAVAEQRAEARPGAVVPQLERLVRRAGKEGGRVGGEGQRGDGVLCAGENVSFLSRGTAAEPRSKSARLTSCDPVLRSLNPLASQVHTRPSTPTLTTTVTLAPALAPPTVGISLNATCSIEAPSSCPSIWARTVPCTRLTARRPPSAPPTMATVEAGLMARQLMPPSRRKRASRPSACAPTRPCEGPTGSGSSLRTPSRSSCLFFYCSWCQLAETWGERASRAGRTVRGEAAAGDGRRVARQDVHGRARRD